MKVASLWSGGKDSCFACYKAMASGYEVSVLLNFTQMDSHTSLSHGLSSEVIFSQAESTGLPVIQKAMPQGLYREEFKELILWLKATNEIKGIVFGDIYLQEHKDWIDKICAELEVEAILPLWGKNTKELMLEIIDEGFKAMVVATKAGLMGEEWLGRSVDRLFLEGLDSRIDPCGEKGEFHTFVYSGPIFKKPIKFKTGRNLLKDNNWFLEITPKNKCKGDKNAA